MLHLMGLIKCYNGHKDVEGPSSEYTARMANLETMRGGPYLLKDFLLGSSYFATCHCFLQLFYLCG